MTTIESGPCWEPETIPGLSKRWGIPEQTIRMWKSRTEAHAEHDEWIRGPVPKAWPKASYVDSSGKELYDGRDMDDWWADHPSNPETRPGPEPKAEPVAS